jgi:acetyl-CoA C-acetyltransferase
MNSVVILSAQRTAIGGFLGSLSSFSPADLGTYAAKSAIAKANVDAQAIEHSVFGHIITTSAADAYLARDIALQSGLSTASSAMNVNRLCGSSIQAIISAFQMLLLGDCQLALAGGAEVMSKGAFIMPNIRKGLRAGHAKVTDLTLGILSDPFGSGHMGMTAELVAKQYGLNRVELDEYSLNSQLKAALAINHDRFTDQIVTIPVPKNRDTVPFHTDEHVKTNLTFEQLQTLRPAFDKEGVVTAGNSSGLNDGAAALVLATEQFAKTHGLKPLAKILGYSFSGVDPNVMGLGPIPAVQKILEKFNLNVQDIDVIESNEAFAAQAIAVAKTLRFQDQQLNPNGGAIALGHPVGATGAILLTKVVYELARTSQRYGLVTMCIGGGQGIAILLERKP